MLKTCWDCIAGDQQRLDDDPYRLHQNGGTQAAPWQPLSIGNNMFATPAALRVGSQIRIIGQMTDDRRLQLDVVTNNGIACQIIVANRPNEIDEEDFLTIIGPGNEGVYNSKASAWFSNGTQYAFRFEMNAGYMNVYAGILEENNDQFLESVEVDVNQLKTISLNGEVEQLIYIFKQRK